MSLLNDALTDLDRAKRKALGERQGQGPKPAQPNSRRFLLPVIAVLVVFLWLVFEKNIFGIIPKKSPSSLAENSTTSPADQNKNTLVKKSATEPAVAAPKVKTSYPVEEEGAESNSAAVEETPSKSVAENDKPRSEIFNGVGTETQSNNAALSNDVPLTSLASTPQKKSRTSKIAHSKNDTPLNSDYDMRLAEQLRSGRYTKYESKAWALLDSDESSRWTAMALADVYSENKNIGQLLQLISRMRDRDPLAAAYVQSQWLIIHGDLKGAAQVLEPFRSSAPENLSVLRLLAGLRSSLNEYSEALILFRHLTELPGFNVNDWLGFAIALEHQGDLAAAQQAYEKISGVPHSDRRINGFVNERIRELAKREER